MAPGPSAVRLTYAGRVCIGLAPAFDLPDSDVAPTETPVAWKIFHSAARERLLVQLQQLHPLVGRHYLVAQRNTDQDLDWICGGIAMHICAMGVAVLDGFSITDLSSANLLHRVIQRTSFARSPRYLIIPDPSFLRHSALAWRTAAMG